jgi:nitrite reductase/ring-hydroxylating ferredoxin subunit
MPFVRVAQTGDVQPGEMRKVSVGGEDILICNVAGTFYAISDLCTHAVASLSEGTLDNEIVTCPRHGGKFNVKTGAAVHFPAFSPVKTFPVKVRTEPYLFMWMTMKTKINP